MKVHTLTEYLISKSIQLRDYSPPICKPESETQQLHAGKFHKSPSSDQCILIDF